MRLDWLGTIDLSWRDLLVIVRRSPVSSALSQEVLGDAVAWTVADHLLAQVVDNTNWLVWAKTEDGSKGKNRPQRLRRPGDPDVPDEDVQYGSDPLSLEEMQEWLGWQTPSTTTQKQSRDARGRFMKQAKEVPDV